MRIFRAVSAIVYGIFIICYAGEYVCADEEFPHFQDFDECIAAYDTASDQTVRNRIFRSLVWDIEHNTISVDAEDAERMTLFAIRVAKECGGGIMRMYVQELLTKYPHPAAAEFVYECLTIPDSGFQFYSPAGALQILVDLRDRRALPLLLDELESPKQLRHDKIIRLLAELGNRKAINPLQEIIHDDHLVARLAQPMIEHNLSRGRDTTRVRAMAAEDAEEIRVSARRAIRDIELFAEHQIVCPFDLDDHAHYMLAKNGFVILPQPANELYEFLGKEYPFVTIDVIFHTFMILVRAGLDELETLVLRERIGEFAADIMHSSMSLKADYSDGTLERLATQNAAFFAVPTVLCGAKDLEQIELPDSWKKLVGEEIDRIHQAKGVFASELLGLKEDYTEYKPRGRHSEKPELAGYFQAMTWLGRGIFAVQSIEQVKQILLLLDVLEQEPQLQCEWEDLNGLLGQFFGEPDDLDFSACFEAVRRMDLPECADTIRIVMRDRSLYDAFSEGLSTFPLPRINTAYLPWPRSMEWKSRTLGLRVFGQRYTRDEDIFQQILDRNDWPPSGLFVAGLLLNSRRAIELLYQSDETSPVEGLTVPFPPLDRFYGLNEAYLYCFEPVFDAEPGTPDLMVQPAWEEKQINSALGAWAEMRHSIALYNKAAHYYMGESMMTDRFHGYVEPYPLFYLRLDTLVQRIDRLFVENMLYERIAAEKESINHELDQQYGTPGRSGRRPDKRDDDWRIKYQRELQAIKLDSTQFREFSKVLQHLASIARKELAGQPQSINDGIFLKNLGGRLKTLSFNHSNMHKAEEPMSLVIDVATEYMNQECLEVGIGRPLPIYVAVPDSGRKIICKGAIYTYYEFTRPFTERLNDTEWRSAAVQLKALGHLPWIATRPQLGLKLQDSE